MAVQVQAGVASVDITPPVGIELSGGPFGKSRGVLDNLYASSLVLDNGKTKLAIVTTDLIGIDQKYVEKIRCGIERRLGIKRENILISTSHTHSGPAGIFLRGWGRIDKKWVKVLQKKLLEVITMACRNMQESRIGWGKGKIYSLSINRRFKNGPIDPEVGVIRIDDIYGKTKAIFGNFTCHPVALHGYRNLISADFVGCMRRTIEKAKGNKIVVLYTNGAIGNINPKGFKGAGKGGVRIAGHIGNMLGKNVLKIADRIKTSSQLVLNVESHDVTLPLALLPSSKQLKERLRENINILNNEWRPDWKERKEYYENLIKWAEEALRVRRKGCIRKRLTIKLQAIQIGDIVLLAIPAEIYVEIGLDIKKSSSFKYTFIVGLANGAIGYIPTCEAFEKGFYEAIQAPKRLGLYSFTTEAENIIKNSGIRLIQKLFKGNK